MFDWNEEAAVSAMPWESTDWIVRPTTAPALRLLPVADAVDSGSDRTAPTPLRPLPAVTPNRVVAVAPPRLHAGGTAAWELTNRGMAWALAGLATLLASGLGTLVWGFLQVSDAPLP